LQEISNPLAVALHFLKFVRNKRKGNHHPPHTSINPTHRFAQ